MIDDVTEKSGNNDQLYMQAASWIAQLDGGRLSHADQLALAEWMARSPQHASELKRLARVWGQVDALIDACSLAAGRTRKKRFAGVLASWFELYPARAGAYSFTALLALFLFLTTIFLFLPPQTDLSPKISVYQTGIGESQDVNLADGSIAFLNTNSIIEVEYSAATRKVKLRQGEALFQVAKDADRPFQVFAGNSIVEAVGTAFLVRLYDKAFDVTVTEGVVQLKSPVDNELNMGNSDPGILSSPPVVQAILSAGQSTKVNTEHSPAPSVDQIDPALIKKRTAWRDGLLIFDGDPLEQVINEVARYMPKTIVISDLELGSLEMSGVFKTGELDMLLSTLETSLNVEVVRVRDDLIYLKKNK